LIGKLNSQITLKSSDDNYKILDVPFC